MAWADYDGDGRIDLMHGNRLYRNTNGTGAGFTEDTYWYFGNYPKGRYTGYTEPSSMAWADFDSDGDLDLLVGSSDHAMNKGGAHIYRNDGSWFTHKLFVELLLETCIGTTECLLDANDVLITSIDSVAFGDYDMDGDYDIVLGSKTGNSQLLRNDGRFRGVPHTVPVPAGHTNAWPKFTDVTSITGFSDSMVTWHVSFADVDADGDIATVAHVSLMGQRIQCCTTLPAHSAPLQHCTSALLYPAARYCNYISSGILAPLLFRTPAPVHPPPRFLHVEKAPLPDKAQPTPFPVLQCTLPCTLRPCTSTHAPMHF